ncbi:MAG: hypothetical protein VB104_02775 [Candidatus Limiplasma sp.]|nr:hypothetical protein [Candidatus Limiplasma sp.]
MALTADKLTELMTSWVQTLIEETAARGNRIYTGVAITGASVTPAAFETGIAAVLAGDVYLYSGAGADDVGNVYTCTFGGDDPVALWKFSHNIRGVPGTIGPQGQKGDTGAAGPQGLQGETGPQGPKGDTGAAGPQGVQGETGSQGPKGDTGETGPQGTKGDTGAAGPQGLQGETGPQGPKGDTGATGVQGPKGDTGAVGPQGIQGATGPQGPKGDTGSTGPQGPAGSGFSTSILWTNPAPGTAFGSQSITVPNIGQYTVIGVEFLEYGILSSMLLFYIGGRSGTTFNNAGAMATENIGGRPFSVNLSTNVVTFGLGSKNGDANEYNVANHAIPQRIYGIA